MKQVEILSQILENAQRRQRVSKKDFYVFDIDSTLYNVSPRIQKIVHDFADLSEILRDYPKAAKKLKELVVHPGDWGIRNIMERLEIPDLPHHFYGLAKDFWKTHFFANHYLHYDEPYPGAVEFLNKLNNMGHHIYYLTGRDQHRMRLGTIQSLRDHGFPLYDDESNLILKPNKDLLDTSYKRTWFTDLIKNIQSNSVQVNNNQSKDTHDKDKVEIKSTTQQSFQTHSLKSNLTDLKNNFKEAHNIEIIFFENEPVNIHEVRQHHPNIKIIFFESTHSGKMPSPKDLLTIKSFLHK